MENSTTDSSKSENDAHHTLLETFIAQLPDESPRVLFRRALTSESLVQQQLTTTSTTFTNIDAAMHVFERYTSMCDAQHESAVNAFRDFLLHKRVAATVSAEITRDNTSACKTVENENICTNEPIRTTHGHVVDVNVDNNNNANVCSRILQDATFPTVVPSSLSLLQTGNIGQVIEV